MSTEGQRQPTTVAELIVCPKSSEVVGRTKHDGANLRLDAELVAPAAPGSFRVFVRVLRDLNESFSIGLTYRASPAAKDTVLLRVNGDHGTHVNPDRSIVPPGPHVHYFREPLQSAPPRPGAQMKWATAIGPSYLSGRRAWQLFCWLANITPSPKLTAKVIRLYDASSQLTLE